MEEVQWIWLNDRKNMMSKKRVLDSEIITLESRLSEGKAHGYFHFQPDHRNLFHGKLKTIYEITFENPIDIYLQTSLIARQPTL